MSLLEEEIYSQPLVLQQLLDGETENTKRLADQLRAGGLCEFNYVVIAARGSSDNAARYAQYLLGARNRLPVSLATPSLYSIYGSPPTLSGALVIGISQSGHSPDILSVISEGRKQGCPTLAITNDPDSPLAKTAEHHLFLHAGQERSVAASKTYSASLAALALFSSSLMGDNEGLNQLRLIPELIERTLSELKPILPRVERYRYMVHCTVIGRGFNYATAFEIALKIKELTRVVAESYSSADFRHGPIAMVEDGFPVLIIAPSGAVSPDLKRLMDVLIEMDAELLVISDDSDLLSRAHLALPFQSGLPEWLSPLVAVVPGQLFSLALAQVKGLNPDKPAGLQKITETT